MAGAGLYVHIADGINNHGQIVGHGTKDGIFPRAFLLTPVEEVIPEPSIVVLFVGMLMLTMNRREYRFQPPTITAEAAYAKGGRRDILPISDELAEILRP